MHNELDRGIRMITGWPVRREVAPGWIGLVCPDDAAASWLRRATMVGNVAARCEGNLLLLPAGPAFRLKQELKNVVTAVAKTHLCLTEHTFSIVG